MTKTDDVLTMPIKDLQKNIAKVREHVAAIEALLPGLVGLTPDARKHSTGRFRAGEAEALSSVLNAAQLRPELFASLGNQDHGDDPNVFEVALLRDRLERAALLGSVAEVFDSLNEGLADTQLHMGDLSRPVMLLAYNIAKTLAQHDGVIANAIRPALEFFAKIGRAGAATRKKPAA